jgi:hypothetical protein
MYIFEEFIKLNTPIISLSGMGERKDFSSELKLNYNICSFPNHFPWSYYYMERNLRLLEIKKNFKVIQISKVNTFDILFSFMIEMNSGTITSTTLDSEE